MSLLSGSTIFLCPHFGCSLRLMCMHCVMNLLIGVNCPLQFEQFGFLQWFPSTSKRRFFVEGWKTHWSMCLWHIILSFQKSIYLGAEEMTQKLRIISVFPKDYVPWSLAKCLTTTCTCKSRGSDDPLFISLGTRTHMTGTHLDTHIQTNKNKNKSFNIRIYIWHFSLV